jgi:hypothetical protein
VRSEVRAIERILLIVEAKFRGWMAKSWRRTKKVRSRVAIARCVTQKVGNPLV